MKAIKKIWNTRHQGVSHLVIDKRRKVYSISFNEGGEAGIVFNLAFINRIPFFYLGIKLKGKWYRIFR